MDIRYGLRMLFKNPGVTAAADLSLALGIGANATIFTWVKAVLLDPLAGVAEADRIVVLAPRARDGSERSVSYPNYRDLRDRARTYELVGQEEILLSITDGDRVERAFGMLVTGNYFDALGVRPSLGRTFRPEEDGTPNAARVVVLAHHFWHRRFAADPSVVGRTVRLNTYPYTVIGVAPERFVGTALGIAADAFVPMMQQPELMGGISRLEQRGSSWMTAVARLKPETSLEQANAELTQLRDALEREFPTNEGWQLSLVPLWNAPWGAPSVLLPVLMVLSAVVMLVLLIACANVANLLLSKAVSRRREMAVRMSLGASRAHIVRQLLTESLLLAVMSGAAGLVVAYWSAGLLMLFVPPVDAPVSLGLEVDGGVLLFAVIASMVTGIIFGVAPAIQASRPDMVGVLREEAGRASPAHGRTQLRNALVIAQIALCLILLIGAGLFLQSLRRAQALDPGFDPDNLLLASFDLTPNGYDSTRGLEFQRNLIDRVRAIPGIESAALGRLVPLGFSGSSSTGVHVEGYTPPKDEEVVIQYNQVGHGYFETMRIPIVRGRTFSERDLESAPGVMVVNEAMARRYWPGADPVGRYVRRGDERLEVVGIAKDGKYRSLAEPPRPYMYFPLAQSYRSETRLHVRSAQDPARLAGAVRQAFREVDPNLPVGEIVTMHQYLEQAVFAQRIGATLLSIFGALALTLAAVGLYSVMSYAVSQRTHEIGIRLALGASPGELRRMVVSSGMKVAAVGLAVGAAGALGVSRLLTSLLNGVSPTDPLTFGIVLLTLAAVAFVAALVPARRASSVDPIVALRYE